MEARTMSCFQINLHEVKYFVYGQGLVKSVGNLDSVPHLADTVLVCNEAFHICYRPMANDIQTIPRRE